MEFIDATRLLGRHTRTFALEVLPLCLDLFDALFNVFVLFLRLFLALIRPLLAVLPVLRRIVQPLSLSALSAAWRLFSHQSSKALAVEAAVFGVLVFFAVFEYQFGFFRYVFGVYTRTLLSVSGWYRNAKLNVRSKSKLAAMALSHVVFVVPVCAVLWVLNPVVLEIVRRWGLLSLAYARPCYRTLCLLYSLQSDVTNQVDAVEDRTPSTPNKSTKMTVRSRSATRSSICESVPERRLDSFSTDDDDANTLDATPDKAPIADSPAATVMQRRRVGTTVSGKSSSTHSASPRTARRNAVISSSRKGQPTTADSTVSFTRTPVSSRKAIALGEHSIRTPEEEVLRFWVVFGVAWSVRNLLRFFTPAILGSFLNRWDTFLFVFMLWLQLGFTDGTNVLFPLIASFLRQGRYLRMNPSASAEQLNIFLRVLVAFGIIHAEQATSLGTSLSESGVVLLGIIFFITPRTVTFLGTVLTGYLVPIYLTTYAATPSSMPSARQTWLAYWAVFALVDLIYTSIADLTEWIPLWYHAKLALILWLQIPYYRGAWVLLDRFMLHAGSVATRVRRHVNAAVKTKQT